MLRNVCSYGMATFDSVDLRRMIFSPAFTARVGYSYIYYCWSLTRCFDRLLTCGCESIHLRHKTPLFDQRDRMTLFIRFRCNKYAHGASGDGALLIVHGNCVGEGIVLQMRESEIRCERLHGLSQLIWCVHLLTWQKHCLSAGNQVPAPNLHPTVAKRCAVCHPLHPCLFSRLCH